MYSMALKTRRTDEATHRGVIVDDGEDLDPFALANTHLSSVQSDESSSSFPDARQLGT
jgi:hypothetical protein